MYSLGMVFVNALPRDSTGQYCPSILYQKISLIRDGILTVLNSIPHCQPDSVRQERMGNPSLTFEIFQFPEENLEGRGKFQGQYLLSLIRVNTFSLHQSFPRDWIRKSLLGAISIDSVEIDPSLLMMRECVVLQILLLNNQSPTRPTDWHLVTAILISLLCQRE